MIRSAWSASVWTMVLCCGCAPAVSSTVEAPRHLPDPTAVRELEAAVERVQQDEKTEQALAMLKAAVKRDPLLWEARYNLGVLLAREGELGAALSELQTAFELAPNAEDVAVALGQVLGRLSRWGDAALVLEDFLERTPKAVVARKFLVTHLRSDGRLDAALQQARLLLEQSPGDPAALSELALTHLAKGEVDVAELLVKEAMASGKVTANAERAAGLIALARGDDALAFRHFQRATELDPSDSAARLNTATVLLQAGVYERAAENFRLVLQVDPRSLQAKLGLAAVLHSSATDAGSAASKEAERLLLSVLEQEPGHYAAAYNLALLYDGPLRRPEDAVRYYQRFYELAPEQHPARVRIGEKLAASHRESPASASPTHASPPP